MYYKRDGHKRIIFMAIKYNADAFDFYFYY